MQKRSGVIISGDSVDRLKSVISRIENLETEKAGLAADIKDVFAEARGNGFDVPAIRKIIKLRKKDASEQEEEELIFDTYRRCLGMLPLFDEQESGAA